MASKRIQGITIEIGADTSKLSDELKKSDKAINSAKANLKDVNKLLKGDPKSIELLTQKQKYLTEAIEGTKEKLEKEKQALEQLKGKDQTEEVVKQQEALAREIAETEQELKSLENEYKEFGSVGKQQTKAVADQMQSAGDAIKSAGQNISNVGVGMTKYVTGPIVAAGAASVAAFKEVDAGMDQVAKKTGAIGEELKNLQKEAKDLYKTMAVSAEDAGNAVGEVNTRFGLTGDELEKVSGEFLKFAKINDTDVTNSIDSVDSIMKKFGKDSKQVGEVLGLLTRASQKSGISIDTLQSSLASNGASLQELGFGLEESVNLLSMLEQNGVDAGTAMTGLKKAVVNAAKQGKSADYALKDIVARIKYASDETRALQIAQEAFGTKGAAEMVNAIRSGRFSLDQLATSLSEYGTVVDDTFAATQDATDQATIAMNNLKLAGSELAESGFSAFAPVLEDIVEKLQKFVDWFAALDDETKKTIVSVAGVVAALGPLLIFIGKLISAVGTIVGFVGKIPAALGAIKGGLAAAGSTISGAATAITGAFEGVAAALGVTAGVLLGAIAAVIGAIVVWVKNWDEIKEAAGLFCERTVEHFQELKAFLIGVFDSVKEAAGLFVERTVEHFNELKAFVAQIWDAIKTAIVTKVTEAVEKVKSTFTSIKDFFSNLIAQAKQWGIDLITSIVNGIISKINDVKNAAANIGNAIRERLHFSEPDVGPLSDFNSWMPDMMSQMAQQINAGIPSVQSAMQNVAGTMAGQISPDYSGQLNSINQGIGQLAAAGGGNITVPVYIGQQKFAQAVVDAGRITNYRNGGRS